MSRAALGRVSAPRLPFLAVALVLSSGCVEHFARRSTNAALQAAREHVESSGALQEHVEDLARRATRSALEEVLAEERRGQIVGLSEDIASGVAHGLREGMRDEIDRVFPASGEGPLTLIMQKALQRAVEGAFFPQCTGSQRGDCINGQIQNIARIAAEAAVGGAQKKLGLTTFLLAFGGGVLTTLVLLSTWITLRSHYRRSPTGTEPHTA
jgi:hypothetical protein